MSLAAVLLVAVAVTDLVRWSPELVSARRSVVAATTGVVATVLAAALLSASPAPAAVLAVAGAAGAVGWVAVDGRAAASGARAATGALLVVGAVTVVVTALSPLLAPLGTPWPLARAVGDQGLAARWYTAAAPPALAPLGLAPAVVTVVGALFLTATANRLVRLVLVASGAAPRAGEAALRGGRLLGPLERVFLLVLAMSGDLTAAAVVVAAKGLLRLPEIRTARQEAKGASDTVTEYFLVGTLASWLLALAVAGLVRLTVP